MALRRAGRIFLKLENIHRRSRFVQVYFQKNIQSSKTMEKIVTNKPIEYSKSPAAKLTMADTFHLKSNPAVLPVERYIVLLSLTILLVYIFIREENKLDEILGGTFRYEGDEELKLVHSLLHARLAGLKTDDIEEKLKKVRGQK